MGREHRVNTLMTKIRTIFITIPHLSDEVSASGLELE